MREECDLLTGYCQCRWMSSARSIAKLYEGAIFHAGDSVESTGSPTKDKHTMEQNCGASFHSRERNYVYVPACYPVVSTFCMIHVIT